MLISSVPAILYCYLSNKIGSFLTCHKPYPNPRARMWERRREGMNTLRNSAENTPPFFIAPVFLILREPGPERFGCRNWNSLSKAGHFIFYLCRIHLKEWTEIRLYSKGLLCNGCLVTFSTCKMLAYYKAGLCDYTSMPVNTAIL